MNPSTTTRMKNTEEEDNVLSNPGTRQRSSRRRVGIESSSQMHAAQVNGRHIKDQQKRGWVRQAIERSVYSKECIMAAKRSERSSGISRQKQKQQNGTTNKRPPGAHGGGGHVAKYRKSSVVNDHGDMVVSMDIESPETREYGGVDISRGKKRRRMDAQQQQVVEWIPPVSPYGLLEEELYKDPWKLFVSCILLNKTSAVQVRQVIWDLFREYPTPQDMIQAPTHELEQRIMPLGLYRKRAVTLQRISREYISTDEWKDAPEILHGIGKYACDAYRIFCLGQWRHVTPEDKDLKRYIEFLERTEGFGVGFESTQGEEDE